MGFVDLLKSLIGKKGWDYKERRGKLRVRCRIDCSLLYGTGMIGCEIRDISFKGMQVMCLGKVKKGAQVQLVGAKQYDQAEVHSLNLSVEWVRKETPGWMVGVSFLDMPQQMGKSWLFWEMKEQALKMRSVDQKRESYRVRCKIPARITSKDQALNARVVNLSPGGALVQTTGTLMKVGETITLRIGPMDDLPKVSTKAHIATVDSEGSRTYGVRFMSLETGNKKIIQSYLDAFFKK